MRHGHLALGRAAGPSVALLAAVTQQETSNLWEQLFWPVCEEEACMAAGVCSSLWLRQGVNEKWAGLSLSGAISRRLHNLPRQLSC